MRGAQIADKDYGAVAKISKERVSGGAFSDPNIYLNEYYTPHDHTSPDFHGRENRYHTLLRAEYRIRILTRAKTRFY